METISTVTLDWMDPSNVASWGGKFRLSARVEDGDLLCHSVTFSGRESDLQQMLLELLGRGRDYELALQSIEQV